MCINANRGPYSHGDIMNSVAISSDAWKVPPSDRALPTHDLLIDGQRVPAAAAEYFESIDPATEQPIARVAAGGAEDIDAAVHAARSALRGPWGSLRGRDRAELLLRFAAEIRTHADELVALE